MSEVKQINKKPIIPLFVIYIITFVFTIIVFGLSVSSSANNEGVGFLPGVCANAGLAGVFMITMGGLLYMPIKMLKSNDPILVRKYAISMVALFAVYFVVSTDMLICSSISAASTESTYYDGYSYYSNEAYDIVMAMTVFTGFVFALLIAGLVVSVQIKDQIPKQVMVANYQQQAYTSYAPHRGEMSAIERENIELEQELARLKNRNLKDKIAKEKNKQLKEEIRKLKSKQ